jgi:hypothetical protein
MARFDKSKITISTRVQPIAADSSPDAVVNQLINFAKQGCGDTQMFGLLARRPEWLKRIAPGLPTSSLAKAV